jgi:DNA-binding transcriptional MerR regulator
VEKSPDAFRTISEVAAELAVPQHVLRFWESKFPQVKPMKRGGGRRYYRPQDLNLLRGIRHLLYGDGFTIRGVQKVLREQGVRFVVDCGRGITPVMSVSPTEGEVSPSLDKIQYEDEVTLSPQHMTRLKFVLDELNELSGILKSAGSIKNTDL